MQSYIATIGLERQHVGGAKALPRQLPYLCVQRGGDGLPRRVANPTILTGKLRICAGEPFNAELLKLGCVPSHVPILFQWSWSGWIDRRFDPVDPRFGLCVQRTINNSTRNAKGCTWEAAPGLDP
jgi:hypothetical protein